MRVLYSVGICIFLASGAFAQTASITSLVGTVTDQAGSAVLNAKVTAVNKNTQDRYAATTNEQGFYRIEFVRVGTYNIEQPR